jgi:vacuolar iron transporter family protein
VRISYDKMESSTAPDAGINPQEEKIEGEMHSSHGAVVKDVVMGFADGLTVPFAVTAGLSS